jgi:hypothetical protein
MSWLTAIFNAPGVIKEALGLASKGIDYYLKKADGNVQVALELMKTEQAANTVRIAGMSHPIWWLGWIGFVSPFAIYTWKVVVWDKVLQWGITDPIGGVVGEWGGIIVASIFGGSFAMGALGLIFNRVTK